MYHVDIKTDVTTEPLTDAVIRNYLKYTGGVTAEHTLITQMVKEARELCEEYTNLSFAQKTLVGYFSKEYMKKYRGVIRLPHGPHSSVTSVYSYDSERSATLLTLNSDYYRRGRQFFDIYVGSTIGETLNEYLLELDYEIEYVAGYGAGSLESLPESLIGTMRELVKTWYHDRGGEEVLTRSAKSKLNKYRKRVWF